MCTPNELAEKEKRIQQLKAEVDAKIGTLKEKVRSGTATPDEQKELNRLRVEARVMSNAS